MRSMQEPIKYSQHYFLVTWGTKVTPAGLIGINKGRRCASMKNAHV